ncbi:MAG: flagellar motor switch protein FliM [Oscillospiraceae bacterium]|nr:flagellar motor switch protein FliM [Oscillospiraceae bacterium]
MGDKLSQDEIDALFNSLATEGVQSDSMQAESESSRRVRDYKFTDPTKFGKDHIHTLKIINDTYARLLQNLLQGYLRTIVSIQVAEVQPMAYLEFNNSISEPTSLAVIDFHPLDGSVILDIAPQVAFAIFERILGGTGGMVKLRTFSEIEIAVLERIVNLMVGAMVDPWENVLRIKPRLEKIETNSQFVKIVSESETVALVTFSVTIGEIEGYMNLCIPYLILEPVIGKLSTRFWYSSHEKEITKETRANVNSRLENTYVTVRAIVGRTYVSVGDFVDIQHGDVIPLETNVDGVLDIMVGNLLKYRGKPGVRKGKVAVKVTEIVEEEG